MELPAPFGKYHLLQRLAVGGMAEVFLAKAFGAAGFERILVIKKILPHMSEDEEFITMFIDEARIASTLNHSNIIQITELGREDKDYYIAMEYTMGQDLSRVHQKLSQQKRTMPIPIAVLIASRICEGLEYAHRKKDSTGKSLDIIHRDVSPGNILVSYDGDIKIIDFGIAKAQNRMGRTTAGTLKGKFGYMSPEQVRGHGLDHRSDIFSVGILLYEMLTNERLFGAESDFGTLEKVRNAIVVPPTTYNSKIPAELERVVMQSLAREPEERYEWASDMQEDLVRFLMTEGSLTTSKSLGLFMRELFRQELEKENERLSVFRKRGYPWADAAKEENKQSAPDTMEMPAVEEEPEPEPPDMSDEFEDEDTGEVEIIEGSRGGYKMPKEDKFAAAADSQAPAEPVDLSRGGGEDNAATQIFMSRDLPSEEEQAGPVVVGGGMGDYDPTGQYDDLTPGSEGEAEEESGAVPDLAPKSEGDYEPTGSLPDLTPQGEGNYEPTASLSDMAADSIPDLSPPPDGEVDGQVHQPTMIMSAAEVEASEPGEDEKPLPREPSKPGRSKAKNRSLQKRPPRKPGASTGTEALSGRKGRPGPLTGPEPRPAPKPKKKKSALLGIVATFLGGLCLAGLIGYFMFMYKGDTPGETVPDKPGELTKPVTGPDKNGPPSDLLVDDKPPPSDGGSLAGFGVEPDPEPPTAPDGGELDGVEVAVAARDGGAEDPPPADAQAGDAQPEDPKPDDPKPDDPKPDDPKPDDPKPDDPKPDDPKPDDPKPDDPKPDDPKPADPEPAEVKKPDPKPSSTKKKKRKKKKTRVAKLSGCELKVVSTPSGADILLNGKASGKTPKTFRGLDPKKNYFVVLRKDGYKKHFEGVKFKGKKKAAVKAALKSSGSKSQPTAKDKKPPATAAKGGKGYLVANTTPWAKVIIDGKDTGKWTPVVGKNKIALKSGRHVITFQTKEGKKLTVKVNIEPGKTAKVIKKIN